MPASTIDAANGSIFTNNTDRAIHNNSLSPSTGGEPQMTEHPDETLKNGKALIKLPQEILDLIWKEALDPWLKKRVIVLDGSNWIEDKSTGLSCDTRRLHFSLSCANPTDVEASEFVGNIRLVDKKARSTVSCSSSKFRRMFPDSPDLSRKRLGKSFKAQHADFQNDVFWLSRNFLLARFQYINYDREGEVDQSLSQDLPQPSHMMLSLRHMLAMMQMIYIRDTPCIGSRVLHIIGLDDPLGDFRRVVQISTAERLRTLTVLLPQNVDEWSGKVDYEDLEHKPFGTSVEEKASVLELARTQEMRNQLEQIYTYWSDLISVAENHGVDLPTLQFSRRRS